MNTFFNLFIAVCAVVALAKVSIVVADTMNAKEVVAQQVAAKAAAHQRNVEDCAAGRTNAIVYNGTFCKHN